jgi:UDP-N-acetylglucosamine 1-carboxyvinyltransferase
MISDVLRIEGGAPLVGKVRPTGFKHALVPIIAATIMTGDQMVEINNAPDIEDARVLSSIIGLLGGAVSRTERGIQVDATNLRWSPIPEELSSRVHGSLYLVAPMLARFGRVELGSSGGCQIGGADEGGRRPVHHVVEVLERFGARFSETRKGIIGSADALRACEIDILDFARDTAGGGSGPLVSGATKTAILAAALSKGTTVIRNPYPKIDVIELLDVLEKCGVRLVRGAGRLVIEGQANLRSATHELPSDLIEVVTYIAAAVYLQSDITIELTRPERVLLGLRAEFDLLMKMGVEITLADGQIRVGSKSALAPQNIIVSSNTIFSDSHPFFALMLCRASERSTIQDRVWVGRYDYAKQCVRLGADFVVDGDQLEIRPGRPWRQNEFVHGSDLRGTAVLCLAALGVSGATMISGAEHLARGYVDFVANLRSLGANILQA